MTVSACSSNAKSTPPDAEIRAREYSAEAARRFEAGRRQEGVQLATRALVVRLAHYGVERPEPALSFIQLGDMRWKLEQLDWARQCYVRALELSVPHERTHPEITRAAATRLAALHESRGDSKTAARLLSRFAPQGAAP